MILLTGAAGKSGLAITKELAKRGQLVRALVHRESQVEAVRRRGALDAIVGDMQDAKVLEAAMTGVAAVYHICPNVSPEEESIGQLAIQAAQKAGVERFVYHSVLHPQVEAMPHHWQKMRVEERLFASGLVITVLQPAAYMQNLLANITMEGERAVYTAPYGASSRLSLVDLYDVAEAAAIVLTQPGHEGAVYELAGPAAPSQEEVVKMLGDHLGRRAEFRHVPVREWRQRALAQALGQYQIEALVGMFRYYDRHGLIGNPNVLAWLLGRPPTSLNTFFARELI